MTTSNQGAFTLLANASSASDDVEITWHGGSAWFAADATFGGGTVKLQYKLPNGTWIDVPSASHTALGVVAVNVPAGLVRANVATSTAVYAYLISNPAF
jgi:hypothetical protein